MISACLIVKNEEKHIDACLQSVSWADEIVLVDSGSTDKTIERARNYKASIFDKPFVNYADQKNFALSKAKGDWIFFIDADERVPAELAKEIQEAAANGDKAYEVRRHTYFLGHRLRFSGTQDDAPVRLFPRGKAEFRQPVHEELATSLGIARLKNPMIHYTTATLDDYRAKLARYTDLEVEAMQKKGRKGSFIQLVLGPPAKWFQLYILKLGILDGLGGFYFAGLSAYYHFVKNRKLLNASA